MKNILLPPSALLAAALTFAAGCASTEKIPVEDPLALKVCAAQIAVLRDPYCAPNSREKYEAAKYIADHVDFSFARNISTLDKIFLPSEVHVSETGNEFVFSYPYRENDVQFRFVRHGETVIMGEAVER
ncbi:MAG: hypothetical protein PHI85_10145 [Victivallaceae bacterium]|nr:hypothetical protein [Victivallaceae bacterium]